MGLLDQVLGGVMGGSNRSSAGATGAAVLLPVLMSMLSGRGGMGGAGGLGGLMGGLTGGSSQAGMGGGLGGLLNQFTQAGHGDIADSWVGTGQNRPVAPNQLEAALGRGTIDDLSRQTGMGRDDLLSQLSTMLPQAVDQLTPHGRMPNDDEMKHW